MPRSTLKISARAAKQRHLASAPSPSEATAPRLDLAIIEEVCGLHWRVRTGRTILASGFADHADAEAWLDAIIQLETLKPRSP